MIHGDQVDSTSSIDFYASCLSQNYTNTLYNLLIETQPNKCSNNAYRDTRLLRVAYVIAVFTSRCNEPCPSGRWGPGCAFLCDCKDSTGECHPETGRCIHDDLDNTVSVENSSYSRNTDEENSVTVNFTIVQLDRETSRIWETAETTTEGNK